MTKIGCSNGVNEEALEICEMTKAAGYEPGKTSN